MTDIHCHLLYDIDDGCRDIDESVEMISRMKDIGFDNIIITPHYIEEHDYCENNAGKLERLNNIKEKLKENDIDVNLFLGNEVFINEHIPSLIEDGEIYPINNSKYVLIEFPFSSRLLGLYDILDEVKNSGYIPIIAHPERYFYYHDNYGLIDELKRYGVLFQCNYSSVTGHYGRDAMKLIKYMLKHKYVDFLGTDIHNLNRMDVIRDFDKINKLFNKWAGKDYYNQILTNCDNLVN